MASFYQFILERFSKRFGAARMLKHGLNWSPMYRRSTGKIIYMSKDSSHSLSRIKISWKNRNYMNSIYGGSIFSAVDPIPMMQLIQLLGKEYVVWDKSAEVFFKRPAREDLYFEIIFTIEEIKAIQETISKENEMTFSKCIALTDKKQETIYCEIEKRIYIADKVFYLKKKEARKHQL